MGRGKSYVFFRLQETLNMYVSSVAEKSYPDSAAKLWQRRRREP